MFKKIVKSIAAIKTENDRDECYWQIDRAFEEERISFEDHELLYGLAGMILDFTISGASRLTFGLATTSSVTGS